MKDRFAKKRIRAKVRTVPGSSGEPGGGANRSRTAAEEVQGRRDEQISSADDVDGIGDAYTQQIYSSRQITKGLRGNVNFMWLSGGNQPDFRTINEFRGEKMRGVIEEVFTSVLELLVEEGYVKLENYFVDGSKVEANANQHKVVWEKSRAKYQQRLRAKVKELLKEIEAVNEAENEANGDKDLEELGGGGEMDAEKLEKKIAELNQRLKEKPEDKKLAKAVKVMEKDYLLWQKRYEETTVRRELIVLEGGAYGHR